MYSRPVIKEAKNYLMIQDSKIQGCRDDSEVKSTALAWCRNWVQLLGHKACGSQHHMSETPWEWMHSSGPWRYYTQTCLYTHTHIHIHTHTFTHNTSSTTLTIITITTNTTSKCLNTTQFSTRIYFIFTPSDSHFQIHDLIILRTYCHGNSSGGKPIIFSWNTLSKASAWATVK